MGVDPLSLALIGGGIFQATQAGKGNKKKTLDPSPLTKISQGDTTQQASTQKRRRGSLLGQQQFVDEQLG